MESHLEGFEQAHRKQSKVIVADSGYGSEENYEMLKNKGIEGYVKYNYFHKEQKRKMKNNPFLVQNLFYNAEQDFFVCPMGQRMARISGGKRISETGYVSQISYYQATSCNNCPLRGLCHQSKGNRRIEVNHRLNELKRKARERLNSEKGLEHLSKRPIEPEVVFGQLKSNNKFTRFTLRGMEKVETEFFLMALGHSFRKWMSKIAQTTLKSIIFSIITLSAQQNKGLLIYSTKVKTNSMEPDGEFLKQLKMIAKKEAAFLDRLFCVFMFV